MPTPLGKLPHSEEDLVMFSLSTSRTLVGTMRYLYAYSDSPDEHVDKRFSIWIRNNWDWAVKDFLIVCRDSDVNVFELEIEFAFASIVLGNKWAVDSQSKWAADRELFQYAMNLQRN
jgi:hypothetical protein